MLGMMIQNTLEARAEEQQTLAADNQDHLTKAVAFSTAIKEQWITTTTENKTLEAFHAFCSERMERQNKQRRVRDLINKKKGPRGWHGRRTRVRIGEGH